MTENINQNGPPTPETAPPAPAERQPETSETVSPQPPPNLSAAPAPDEFRPDPAPAPGQEESRRSAGAPPPPAAPPKKPGRGCVIAIIISAVLLTVLAGGAAVIVIAAVAMNSPLPALPAKQYPYFNEQHISGSGPSSNKIAVIDVRGVILNDGGASSFYSMADSKNITDQIKFASKDKNVKGIIINIDSPGGEVVASDLIYQEIRAARAKGVPVVACMNSIAASGGYYVAAGCDYIVAHKMTLTGSIGVIIETYKYYELFTKIGVRSEVYKSGPMKDILDGSRPSTEAEKKIVQDLVNATYNDFVGIVAQGRKIPAQIIKTTEIGDGRVFDGEQALKLKLVDELGYFDTAVKKAAGMSGLNENNVQVIRYQKPFSLAQLFGEASASFSGKPLSLLPPGADRHMSLEPGKMYFLPQVW